jgi:hypothetical protein
VTPEEEFAARSQLKWQRDGDEWVLLYRRRRSAAFPLNVILCKSEGCGNCTDSPSRSHAGFDRGMVPYTGS